LRLKVSVTGVDADILPEKVVLRREQDREVIGALDRLRPQDREVLTLRLWEEASFDDIATVMRCSRHAAEQRYGRALRRLRSATRRSGHEAMSGRRPDLPTEEPIQ
jgi:RNA polymerase sigma factor (sigma-70 family)